MRREPELSAEQRRALSVDEDTVRVAWSPAPLELAIGRTLDRLFRGDRLIRLGYAKQLNYAHERLGVSPRLMYDWLRLARGVAERPVLRRAVVAGVVSRRKALAVMTVAVGADEKWWTAAAMALTLKNLKAALQAAGKESPDEPVEFETLWLKMTAAQQDRLDAALAVAREQLGADAARWRCVEAICQEWSSDHAEWLPDEADDPPRPAAGLPPDLAGTIDRQLRTIEEATGVVDEPWDEEECECGDDPVQLDARLMRLLEARGRFDLVLGPLLAQVAATRVWETLGFSSLAAYAHDRLGMSGRVVRERVWLERRMGALPALRVALADGRLTFSKALLVARDATLDDVEARIADAASTTWQQTERESTEAEQRRNRAAGVRRLWGPKEAAAAIAVAIAAARAWALAEQGRAIDDGEALALMADHAIAVWTAHGKKKRVSKQRRDVLMRHGGLCAVPGCSQAASHAHHIRYRSRGGCDEPYNTVAVCAAHHLRAIHRGRMTVAGRAGERLVWRFGAAEAVPLETWITEGNDDVRRAG